MTSSWDVKSLAISRRLYSTTTNAFPKKDNQAGFYRKWEIVYSQERMQYITTIGMHVIKHFILYDLLLLGRYETAYILWPIYFRTL